MSRTSALILLGILIMLMPFSGLPLSLRTLLTLVFGVIVLGIGLSFRAHEVRQAQSPVETRDSETDSPAAPTSISSI